MPYVIHKNSLVGRLYTKYLTLSGNCYLPKTATFTEFWTKILIKLPIRWLFYPYNGCIPVIFWPIFAALGWIFFDKIDIMFYLSLIWILIHEIFAKICIKHLLVPYKTKKINLTNFH